jgi:serine/threonine protein phosphatase PrpC
VGGGRGGGPSFFSPSTATAASAYQPLPFSSPAAVAAALPGPGPSPLVNHYHYQSNSRSSSGVNFFSPAQVSQSQSHSSSSSSSSNWPQLQLLLQQQQWELTQAVQVATQETATSKYYLTSEEYSMIKDFFLAIPKFKEKYLRDCLLYNPCLPVARIVDYGALEGQTPLHFAASGGCNAAIELMVSLGAPPPFVSVWVRDLQGRTPLHLAAENGHVETCLLLRRLMKEERGGDIYQDPVGVCAPMDLGGNTPLGWAAKAKSGKPAEELEKALFQRGDGSILQKTPMELRIGKSPWRSNRKTDNLLFSGSSTDRKKKNKKESNKNKQPTNSNSFFGTSLQENLVFAFSEAQGWTGKMEDRIAISSPLCATSRPSWHFFAIFDGHGGIFTAEYLSVYLSQAINEIAREYQETLQSHLLPGGIENDLDTTPELLKEILIKSCLKADKDLQNHPRMKVVKEKKGKSFNIKDSSGSTGIIALITSDYVAIANVGDSRAVLGRRSTSSASVSVNSSGKKGITDPFAFAKVAKEEEQEEHNDESTAALTVTPNNTTGSARRRSSGSFKNISGLDAFPLSRDHKGSIPEEKERAIRAGAM